VVQQRCRVQVLVKQLWGLVLAVLQLALLQVQCQVLLLQQQQQGSNSSSSS
jgi:hypothetical protein